MSFDYYKIINGTLEKRFENERRALVEDFDESSASDFFYVYKDTPLSFIIRHSRDIFSEPYYGYDFYLDIIKNVAVCPTDYSTEMHKVSEYIEEATKRGAPSEQIDKYARLLNFLEDLVDSYGHISHIIQLVKDSENGEKFLAMVFDGLYYVYRCEKKYEDNEKCLGHTGVYRDYIAEAIFTSNSAYASIVLGLMITMRYPEAYASCLVDLTNRMCRSSVTPESYGFARRGVNAIKYLMASGFVAKTISTIPNRMLLEKWSRIANCDADEILPIPVADDTPVSEEFNPEYDGSNLGDLSLILEAMDNDPKYIANRYDLYRYNAEKLDSDSELSDKDADFQENSDYLQDAYEAEALMLEWEADGSPNKVIQSHIMTSKEREEAEEERRKEKKSPINNLIKKNDESEKESVSESELCEKIKKSIEIASKITPADTDSEKKDNEETLSALRSDCKKYKSIIDVNKYETAKKLYEELRDEILAADNNVTEEYSADTDKQLALFLEGKEIADGDDSSIPEKPKPDIATRVQNKALDHAAKDNEKAAKNAEDRQKLKNAANAISQKPKRQIKGLKDFVDSIDKWDENRRKKFMLKPGFRHRIFKFVRNALMLGVVSQFDLAWIPMAGLLAHCSKLKDKRIRTELTRELENEIEICKAKIDDANAEGDKKSKYELMRIKDKLEAEKTRVKINSKYI